MLFTAEIVCTHLPIVGPHVVLNGTSVTYGSTLTLSCFEGYQQVAGSTNTTCVGAEEWNGTELQCAGIQFIEAF